MVVVWGGPVGWEVAIPAVASMVELETYLAGISSATGIIGAQPEFVGELDTVEPNDPRYDEQSNITSFGLDDAWTFEHRGSDEIIVAVIDCGVNLNHPDLASKLLAGRDIREGDDDPNDEECLHGTHVAGIIGAESNNSFGITGVNRSERFTSWFGLVPRTYSIDILSVGNVRDDKTKNPSSTSAPALTSYLLTVTPPPTNN